MASFDPDTQDQSQQAGLYAVESDTVLLKRVGLYLSCLRRCCLAGLAAICNLQSLRLG